MSGLTHETTQYESNLKSLLLMYKLNFWCLIVIISLLAPSKAATIVSGTHNGAQFSALTPIYPSSISTISVRITSSVTLMPSYVARISFTSGQCRFPGLLTNDDSSTPNCATTGSLGSWTSDCVVAINWNTSTVSIGNDFCAVRFSIVEGILYTEAGAASVDFGVALSGPITLSTPQPTKISSISPTDSRALTTTIGTFKFLPSQRLFLR